MTVPLSIVFDLTAIVGGALIALRLLRRRSAALRHWVLTAALVASVAAPPLAPFMPGWHLWRPMAAVVAQSDASTAPTGTVQIRTASPQTTLPLDSRVPAPGGLAVRTVAAAWFAGALLGLAMLALGLGRLWWIAAGSTPTAAGPLHDEVDDLRARFGFRRAVALLHSRHPIVPMTWGFVRPAIVLPDEAVSWPRDRVHMVLSHEMAHVVRGDWLVQMLAEVLRSLCWFNPVLWIAASRLRRESELACDDLVLGTGVEASAYAAQLLELARTAARLRRPPRPAQAIVRPSILERRITAMLNVQTDHSAVSRRGRRVAAAGIAAAAVALAGLSAAAQSQTVLSGTVVDVHGRAVASATLALTSADGDARHDVRADRSGRFQFVALPPGRYTLAVQALGFAPLREEVTLEGAALDRRLTLEIANIEEAIRVTETPPAAPMPPPPDSLARRHQLRARMVERCAEAPGSSCLEPPLKLTDVRPIFPPSLAGSTTELTVVLAATIGIDGLVHDLRVVGTVPGDVAQAAIDAVGQWRFEPTRLDGQPIETAMTTTVRFVPGR